MNKVKLIINLYILLHVIIKQFSAIVSWNIYYVLLPITILNFRNKLNCLSVKALIELVRN